MSRPITGPDNDYDRTAEDSPSDKEWDLETDVTDTTPTEKIANLASALSAAQAEIKGAVRDSLNPHFKNKYADLASVWDACRKPLTDHGLSVVQFTKVVGGESVLYTRLLHVSGDYIEGFTPLLMGKQDMQALGSAITYARRYGLSAMVGISPEDDDGNAAVAGTPVSQVLTMDKPEGYDEWIASLKKSAAIGEEALVKAYGASTPEHRKYLAQTEPTLKDTLKAQATDKVPF